MALGSITPKQKLALVALALLLGSTKNGGLPYDLTKSQLKWSISLKVIQCEYDLWKLASEYEDKEVLCGRCPLSGGKAGV